MRDNDKRKSTTFQRIMENNPENIFAQTDGSIKKTCRFSNKIF